MKTKINKLLWTPDGKQLQHHGIGHTEYRRISANTKSQRKYGDNSKAGILRQHANGIAQVLPSCVHLHFSIFTRGAARLADRLAWRAARATTLPKMRSRQCCPTRSAGPADRESELRTRHSRSLGLPPKQGSARRPSRRPAAT